MTRKSLRTKRIFSIILSLAVALTMMPMSALAADESSSVGNAVAEVTINGTTTQYADIDAAFAAAQQADSGTVRMLKPLGDKKISFCKDTNEQSVDKTVTLMMNGNSLSYDGATPLVIQSGKLIIGDEATISQTASAEVPAVWVDNNEEGADRGTLEFQGKATLTGGLLIQNWGKLVGGLKEGTIITSNSTYSVSVERSTNTYSNVLGLLGDGLAFANYDKSAGNKAGALVDGSVKQLTEDVIVVAHTTHTMGKDNKCACGFTCPHNAFENGVCTICGNGCAHTNVGDDGVCQNCKTQMAVKITASDSTVTYGTDFKAAMDNAANDTKITLLANAAVGNVYLKGKTVTLDLNGKTVKNSSRGSTLIQIGSSNSPASLIITGRGSFISVNQPLVVANGTLDLSQWTGDDSYIRHVTISGANSRFISPNGAGKINMLAFTDSDTGQAADTASLNGGRYDEIAYVRSNTIKLGDLLAEGYAFRQNGTFLEYASELKSNDTVKKVEVVKCPHPDAKDGKCLYCGQTGILARVGDTTYDSVSDAVAAWLANGGTLKLYADYTATDDGTWSIGSGLHTVNLNGHRMSVKGDGNAFKPTNNMHLTVTDGKEIGQIENILLDGSQRGSFTLESGYVGNLEMTGGAVVALKGGSVDKLDVQKNTVSTNLSIQGGSIGELNIKDWANGMHVSATGGSLGAYTLPSDKILADVLDHQYYAEGTSLDKWVDEAAQTGEKFDIKHAPHDFGSTSKVANVPINGSIPFRVDSPSGDATGYYDVRWYRRTNSGAEHMTENRVAGVKVNDTLDVFCVITGLDKTNGAMQWQVAVKDYTIKVVPANLSQEAVVFKQVANEHGAMGNIKDGEGTFVFTPWGGSTNFPTELSYLFEVSCNGRTLTEGSDYTITGGSTAKWAGTHTLTIEGKGNYTGTATHQWEIKPYTLSKKLDVTRIDGITTARRI